VAIVLGIASLAPIALYPLAKRFLDYPQAVLGVVFSWAAPMGWASATGGLDAAALALWAAGFCWILGYDTIYAHQDREDDAMVGIRSSALTLGARTRPFLIGCYVAMIALLGLAGWLAGAGPWFWPAMMVPAGLLARQILLLDIVFSLDSIITALGMASQLAIMVAAVVIAVGFMMLFAGKISAFVEEHPTIKMLALSFLLLIGVALIAGWLTFSKQRNGASGDAPRSREPIMLAVLPFENIGADEQAIHSGPFGRDASDQCAADLTDAQEYRVQAHDGAAIAWELL
jgi:hypothetical protein